MQREDSRISSLLPTLHFVHSENDRVMQSESVASSLSLVYCLFSILYFTLHTLHFLILSVDLQNIDKRFLRHINITDGAHFLLSGLLFLQ